MKWILIVIAGIVLLTFYQLQDERGKTEENRAAVAYHEERLGEIQRDSDAIIHNMKVLEEEVEERHGVQIDFMAEPIAKADTP